MAISIRLRPALASRRPFIVRRATLAVAFLALGLCLGDFAQLGRVARAQGNGAQPTSLALGRQPIVYKVGEANDRLQMIVNTSRILTLDQNIPKVQVNNPDILRLTPLSKNQVQIAAQKPGVTQVNLWNESGEVHSIDVIVFGDAQELQMTLESLFPDANLRVVPLANSSVVSGHVDRPEFVSRIIEVAQDFYPKVINNITVGGVQQVLLHVKVMEVSRTKLRNLGVDWAQLTESGGFSASSITGLLRNVGMNTVTSNGGETFVFNATLGGGRVVGLLEALRQHNLMKILAEPDLVTVSGRPASFVVGGEFPVLTPQSLGTVAIEYKKFGTEIDFVPIVLGGGKIRLEVRPRVSEIDSTQSVTIENFEIPALSVREVDTAVELRAGETLAIAGLVQTRIEAVNRGLPFISDVPYIGTAFRRVREEANEVELLILVTPELVTAMAANEVPRGGPGLNSASPTDCDLYFKGHIEVPRCDQGGPYGSQFVPGEAVEVGPGMPPNVIPPNVTPPGAGAPVPPPPGPAPEARRVRPSQAKSVRPAASRPAATRPAMRQQPQPNRASVPSRSAGGVSQNRRGPSNPHSTPSSRARKAQDRPDGLIGPIGYDVRD